MFDDVRRDGLDRGGLSKFARESLADAPRPPTALASGRVDASMRRSAEVDAFTAWLREGLDEPAAAAAG